MVDAYVVNTDPHHWKTCVGGPQDAEHHPSEYIGQPWHAVPESGRAPAPGELSEGDLFIIRVNQTGVRGIWTFQEERAVEDQSIIPEAWLGDRDYERILYCSEEPERTLETTLPVYKQPEVGQGVLTGTLLGEKNNRPEIAAIYVDALLQRNVSEATKELLRKAHPSGEINSKSQSESKRSPQSSSEGPSVDPEEQANDLKPPKKEYTVSRTVRNTKIAKEVKEYHDHRCQVCGERRHRNGSGYSEAHHIHPLGDSPPGPDERDNILVLCPNHHADFDFGMLQVNPETLKITHEYDEAVDGTQLRTVEEHRIDPDHIRYHNENQ